jgi:serine/threonine protein kinase
VSKLGKVGPYTLLERLGRGGMGEVYLATTRRGERVAIKVLRDLVEDESARIRLEREVRALRRVESPYVARVFDADLDCARPYLVMEHIEGDNLLDRVRRRGPLNGADLVELAQGIATALAITHAAGVIHRDLKPANILMSERGPVLIDFGIAQVHDATRLTMTGTFLGTPGYTAPEIFADEQVDSPADIHGWAATVAFAATGRPTFGRGTAEAQMYAVLNGQADLKGVPVELLPLVRAALHREPGKRPTAALLADRLSRLAKATGDEARRSAEVPAPRRTKDEGRTRGRNPAEPARGRSGGDTPPPRGRAADDAPASRGRAPGETPASRGRAPGETPPSRGRTAGETPPSRGRAPGDTPPPRTRAAGDTPPPTSRRAPGDTPPPTTRARTTGDGAAPRARGAGEAAPRARAAGDGAQARARGAGDGARARGAGDGAQARVRGAGETPARSRVNGESPAVRGRSNAEAPPARSKAGADAPVASSRARTSGDTPPARGRAATEAPSARSRTAAEPAGRGEGSKVSRLRVSRQSRDSGPTPTTLPAGNTALLLLAVLAVPCVVGSVIYPALTVGITTVLVVLIRTIWISHWMVKNRSAKRTRVLLRVLLFPFAFAGSTVSALVWPVAPVAVAAGGALWLTGGGQFGQDWWQQAAPVTAAGVVFGVLCGAIIGREIERVGARLPQLRREGLRALAVLGGFVALCAAAVRAISLLL